MIKYIAYVSSNGEITKLKHAAAVSNPPEGYNTSLQKTIFHFNFDINNPADWIERHYYDFTDQEFKVRGLRPNPHATWNDNYPRWEWDVEDIRNEIRDLRNQKLFYCDWTIVADSPLSEEQKTEARTYRQSLRDFPSDVDLTNITNVSEVVWPAEPSFL